MSTIHSKHQQRIQWQQLCLRYFKLHGLSFKLDALNVLLDFLEARMAEDPSIDVETLLNRILNSIDNQNCT
jgi:hypothetical protein